MRKAINCTIKLIAFALFRVKNLPAVKMYIYME